MCSRLEEITFLFSYIFKKNIIKSKKIILATKTGKRIANNASDLLYEQPLANFKEIMEEIKNNDNLNINLNRFSEVRLLQAYKQLHKVKETEKHKMILKFPALSAKEINKSNQLLLNHKKAWEKKLQDINKQKIIILREKMGVENDVKHL